MTPNSLFPMILLAFLCGSNLICLAKDSDGDEANPAPPNYSGVWIVNGTDGKKISAVSYQDGKRHGLAQGWHSNGELGFVSHYKDGQLEGVSVSWDKDGLVTKMTVDEPDGTHRWTQYFDNGHRSQEQVFKDGKLLRRRMWHSTGSKANDFFCKNGKAHGKVTEWHPNGTVRKAGEYANGEPVGISSCWNDEGKLTRTLHHEDGKIVRIEIYKDDKVVEIETWKDGKPVRTEKVQ